MKIRVGIFPAGTEIGLEINRALSYSTHLEVVGFTSVKDHSEYVYKNYVEGLPLYSDRNFIEIFNEFIEKNHVDYIFPAHDDVQLYLTDNMDKIKAPVITTDIETVRICRSKTKTYKFFEDEDFIPTWYEQAENLVEFPVFIKPDVGQGARGTKIVKNEYELKYALYENPNVVICEYLPGEEFTIDCFTDYSGNLRVCRMRNRIRIRNGISVNSKILPMDDKVLQIAQIINNRLKFNGAWFFQLKKDRNHDYKLLEIAPRVAGTMGISRNTGINYPLLTIFNAMRKPVSIIENKYDIEVDRALINRYKTNLEYDTVYVDFDDTIIVNGKTNSFLMMFLYQLVNKGKRIVLITKHKGNINETLRNYKINTELFDEILHLEQNDEKSKYILDKNAIFIDDSFSERLKVFQSKGIPVFDCSEIEALIDWRI